MYLKVVISGKLNTLKGKIIIENMPLTNSQIRSIFLPDLVLGINQSLFEHICDLGGTDRSSTHGFSLLGLLNLS